MELIEPFGVPDVFVSGVGEVEVLGSNVRITCYAEQKFAGRTQKVVVARIVIAQDALPVAIAAAIAGADCDIIDLPALRLN